MGEKKEEQQELERIYTELNLEKWSIWQSAHSKNKQMELVIERGPAKVEITANSKYGPLTTQDRKVCYSLMKLFWERIRKNSKRTDKRIYVSDRQIARVLKKKWNGEFAKGVTESLYRLRFTAFVWSNSYYDSTKKQTISFLDTFTILSDLKVARTEVDGKVNKEVGYFSFSDSIVENLLNNHTKPLLLDTLLSLKSELAQILYIHLDLVMADKEHYARRTEELFWEDLQLKGAEYKKLSARKRRLDRALLELQGVALSSGTLVSAVLELTKDGEDYKLVCHKSAVIHPRLAAQSQSAPASKPAKPKSAMDQRSAEELVKHFYKLFHTQAKDVCPTRKEIGQASTLLKEY